ARQYISPKWRHAAERFFVELQQTAADWLSLTTTKTGAVYRLKGNPPQAHECAKPRHRPMRVSRTRPPLGRIFWVFLVMGATSLGGGVVGYLRTGLVVRNNWLDDVTFVELLSI